MSLMGSVPLVSSCSGMACIFQLASRRTLDRSLELSAPAGLWGRQTPLRACTSLTRRQAPSRISMRYREPTPCKQQGDKYRRAGQDVGSTEVQISQLSYRVKQLTAHLQANRKDYATQRGLEMILGKRRRLLKYMQATDRPKYENLIKTLGIRPIKVQAAKGIAIRVTAKGIEVASKDEDMPAAPTPSPDADTA